MEDFFVCVLKKVCVRRILEEKSRKSPAEKRYDHRVSPPEGRFPVRYISLSRLGGDQIITYKQK